MLIVTGTKRSGTSLWMQIMIEAGFPYVVPYGRLGRHHQVCQPKRIFESPLRKRIFYATNPDPKQAFI